MSIQCTCADLEKLRDAPNRPGPLTKIANYEETADDISVIDRVRRMRFVKALVPEITEYAQAVATLGQKLGKPTEGGKYFMIDPEREEEFKAEKAKIDAEPRTIALRRLPVSAYAKISLTALDLMALEPFIVLPEEPKETPPVAADEQAKPGK